jgi:diguanylate cyclase (GGDEF)-like protein/putative nucleotidyltransferase with HDIG domain
MPSTFSNLSTAAKAYVSVIACAGTATVAYSLYALISEPIGWSWTVLAVLTLVSGSATIKLPSLPATISVSETFVFTSVLLFGSAAGTMTVVLDALVISFWAYKRRRQPLYKSVFNVSALGLTIWLASQVFFLTSGSKPLVLNPEPIELGRIVFPLLAFTIAYFSLNSWIITFAISLERHLAPYKIWRENFVWVSLNYFGGASVAALLVTYTKDLDFTYLAVIVPLLLILYFTFSTSMGRVEDANRHLTQLNTLYMSTIETLAMAIDAKDQITHGHIRRVQGYAVGLATRMGVTDPPLIRAIEAAALLHDMGKLAVPEYILNKPGPLTPAEFEKMKLHASVGADILSAIDFPYPVVPIVRHHHENWNGTGYPDGISGADIPIGARILSVVDCFDALTSDRPYRPRLPDREAIRILMDRRGTMYDPLVVDTFIAVHSDIAPNVSSSTSVTPLRAITDAAVNPAALPPENRLDDISGSTEEMLTLFSLASGLSSLSSLQDVGDVISKHLRRLIPSFLTVFYMYDSEADELVAAHASGESSAVVLGLRIGTGQRLSGWVAANRQTIRNSDPILDFGEAARSMSPRPHSCLSTPLLVGGTLVGVLTLYSTSREAFTEEHQRVAEIVGRQVAPAIQQAAETQRAKASAARDQLTGLPRLEQFRDLAATQVSEATAQRPVSMLLVDVVNLERINRTRGRAAGDEIMGFVVKAARRSLRAGDMLFRHGNDEFVALLLQTGDATGHAIASRISDAVGVEQEKIDPTSRFGITISVVSAPQDGASVEQLLEKAVRRQQTNRERISSAGNSSNSVH